MNVLATVYRSRKTIPESNYWPVLVGGVCCVSLVHLQPTIPTVVNGVNCVGGVGDGSHFRLCFFILQ